MTDLRLGLGACLVVLGLLGAQACSGDDKERIATTGAASGPGATTGPGPGAGGATSAGGAGGAGVGGATGGGGPGGAGVGGTGGSGQGGQTSDFALWDAISGFPDVESSAEIAIDSTGAAIIVGSFKGSMNLGDAVNPMTSFGEEDVFIVKMNPDGSQAWANHWGDSSLDTGVAVAIDPVTDDIVLVGNFRQSLNFGTGELNAGTTNDVFVAKLAPSGAPKWAAAFGGTQPEAVTDVAIDPVTREIIIVGEAKGTMTIGNPILAQGSDIFVARLDVNGVGLWARTFGDDATQLAHAVAVDSTGQIAVTGEFAKELVMDSFTLSAGTTERDIFLATLTPNGAVVQAKDWGDSANQAGLDVKTNSANEVILVGRFRGAIVFGGDTPHVALGSEDDVFMFTMTQALVELRSDTWGDSSSQIANALVVDSNDNVLVSGTFRGAMDFGGNPVSGQGTSSDIFLVKLDNMGNVLWATSFGGTDADEGLTVAVDAADNIFLGGTFKGTMDLGLGPLVSGSASVDAFAAKFTAGPP